MIRPSSAEFRIFRNCPKATPDAVFTSPNSTERSCSNCRTNCSLFVIAYHVGLRRGGLLRIKWSQVDLDASCIWMEAKRANRKPEPVAVPSMKMWHSFWRFSQERTDFLFARGSRPIKDFRDS